MLIWTIGWMFTLGYLDEGKKDTNFFEVLGYAIIMFIAWPLILGMELKKENK